MHHVTKRRRTNTDLNVQKVSVPFDLTITGEECGVHQTTFESSFLETGHLIQLSSKNNVSNSWNSVDDKGGSLLVDRYDARALMDEFSLQQLCQQRVGASFNTDGVINKNSFSCFHRGKLEEEGSQVEIDQRNIARFGLLSDEYKACKSQGKPTVEKNDSQAVSEDSKELNDELFEPTEEQRKTIPHDITLPKTLKQHNIIELTANRVATNRQLEVYLKLKQSNNSQLSFINATDDLHRYYLHLRDKQCSAANHASDKPDSPEGERGSGLNGLLAGYESSGSDEEDTNEAKESIADASAAECTASVTQDETDEQKRRKKRLERLRQKISGPLNHNK